MRKTFAICIALLAIALAGCDPMQFFNAFIPKHEAVIGQQYLEDIRTRNFQPVEDKIDPAYKSPTLPATLEKMASIFPRETPKSVKVVGSNTATINGLTTYNLTYEYEFPHAWALGHIYFSERGNKIQIERMDVYPLVASLEQINGFTLTGKSPIQYAVLALAIFMPVFTIFSAIMCFRTPIPKRKWLWIIFVLLGIGAISLNWTTGEITSNLVSIVLFGASYAQQFYGPAIIQVGFPLGAIIFWTRRKRWKADAKKTA